MGAATSTSRDWLGRIAERTDLLIWLAVIALFMFLVTKTRLKKPWMAFAKKVGFVNSTILLTIVFVLVIGVYSLIVKLGHLLAMPFARKAKSRWTLFDHNQNSLEECQRQF